jgi:Zn-dependent protease
MFSAIFFVIVLVISVILHEVAHGYAALYLGDPTAKYAGRLTLNPIPHIDPMGSIVIPFLLSLVPGGIIFGWAKPVPYNPYNLKGGKYGPAYVAAAGPLTNLLVATIFALILSHASLLGLESTALPLIQTIVYLNLALMWFNLIPVPPLDGSKILFSLLPYKWRRIQQILEQGQLALIIVVILASSIVISPLINATYTILTSF